MKRGPAKLNVEKVEAIKEGLSSGLDGATLGRVFDVSRSTVSRIKNESRWSEVRRPGKEGS